jgi:hypothetical protein
MMHQNTSPMLEIALTIITLLRQALDERAPALFAMIKT